MHQYAISMLYSVGTIHHIVSNIAILAPYRIISISQ